MNNLVFELHVLMPYAINSANRGEFGEVKNASIGGVSRAVMSSQSIKYAIRTLMAKNNIRTNYYINEIVKECFEIDGSLTNEKFVKYVLEACGVKLSDKKNKEESKPKADKHLSEVEMLIAGMGVKSTTTGVTSAAELHDIAKLLVDSYRDGLNKTDTQKRLNEMNRKLDLWTSAFGRMSTDAAFNTVESAVSTSMSYSVDPFWHQNDYFSVIDSLKQKYEPHTAGAANNQYQSFSANVMYRYMNISIETLVRNFDLIAKITEEDLHKKDVHHSPVALEFAKFVADLITNICYCHPIAKQHAMASMPTPTTVALFAGKNIYPLSMDSAFNKAVQASHDKSVVEKAAERVVDWTENDMLVGQYDNAMLWVPKTVRDSTTVNTSHTMNGVYDYIRNEVPKVVLDYVAQLMEER